MTITPRLLTKEAAAGYLSISTGTFDLWVHDGRIPCAIRGTKRWDKRAIDVALDKLSGLQEESKSQCEKTDYDDWLRGE